MLARDLDPCARQRWSIGAVVVTMVIGMVGTVGSVDQSPVTTVSPRLVDSATTHPRAATLTSVGSDDASGPGDSPDTKLSADGHYVVFSSKNSLDVSAAVETTVRAGAPTPPAGEQHIYGRDIATGRTVQLSPPELNAGSPAISGDARFVTYLNVDTGDVWMTDRQRSSARRIDSPDNMEARLVNTPRSDATYQRRVACPQLASSGSRSTGCGPQISADGSTLVYAAKQDPRSPDLAMSARFGATGAATPVLGGVLSMTRYPAPVDRAGNVAVASNVAVSIVNRGKQQLALTGLSVNNTGPSLDAFSLASDTCAVTLAPGQSCTAQVNFDPTSCPAVAATPIMLAADLITQSTTAAGRALYMVTAVCHGTQPGGRGAGRVRVGCPSPTVPMALVPPPTIQADNAGTALMDLGGIEVARPFLTWIAIKAPGQNSRGLSTFHFTSNSILDCDEPLLQLVDPSTVPVVNPILGDKAVACSEGLQLATPSSGPGIGVAGCIAYIMVRASAHLTETAAISLTYTEPGPFPVAGTTDSAVAVLTTRKVKSEIIARRDPAKLGKFSIVPSVSVGVDSDNFPLPEVASPSVSATGRYVAFTSPVQTQSRGQQLAPGSKSVWRHDTDRNGDGKYVLGETIPVSCLPDNGPECVYAAQADSPSISADGELVAFATAAAIPLNNGFRATVPPPPPTREPSQVYVYSAKTSKSMLISAFRSDPSLAANAASWGPVLSGDGTSIAFVSQAGDLVGGTGSATSVQPSAAGNLFFKRLGPSPLPTTRLISTSQNPVAGIVGLPSLETHGRYTAFATATTLSSRATLSAVNTYLSDQLPVLTATPDAVAFGTILLGSKPAPLTMTLTNTGTGPVTITTVTVPVPFHVLSTTCVGALLYPTSSCLVTIGFTADRVGLAATSIEIGTDDGRAPSLFTTFADVPAPRLLASPNVAIAGEVTQIRGENFPPHTKVGLSWSVGLGSGSVTSDANGDLIGEMVIFPRDVLGPRDLLASGPGGQLASASFLVQQPAEQPPFDRP